VNSHEGVSFHSDVCWPPMTRITEEQFLSLDKYNFLLSLPCTM
jgi:hypothetical protein